MDAADALVPRCQPSPSQENLQDHKFEKLLKEFTTCLKEDQLKNRRIKPKKYRKRKIGGGRKSALGLPENQLFFILFYFKNYPTYDVLAFTFNISRGCAFASVQRLLPVLKQTQKNRSCKFSCDEILAYINAEKF